MILRPERYRNAIVPHIYIDGAADGIAFYKRAFGAEELFRIAHPNGSILQAEISICGSVVMIGDPDHRLYGEPAARRLHGRAPYFPRRQRSFAPARSRRRSGGDSATDQDVLWRQFRQRARSIRPCLGTAIVDGGPRSCRNAAPWKQLPGRFSCPLGSEGSATQILRQLYRDALPLVETDPAGHRRYIHFSIGSRKRGDVRAGHGRARRPRSRGLPRGLCCRRLSISTQFACPALMTPPHHALSVPCAGAMPGSAAHHAA